MSHLAICGGEPLFKGQFPAWPVVDEQDGEALLGVLQSGVWGIGGEQGPAFEKEWAEFTGSRYAVLTNSGTTALMAALRACGVGAGDEVIIPAYTFQATATAVILVNAAPVFADVDPGTGCLDPRSAEAVMTPRTKAILPVHLGGCPADLDPLMEVAQRHNLALIEDACQAHGAAYRGKPVGSIGRAGVFSFQSTKNLAAGEGGAVTTSDPAIAAAAGAVRHCGFAPRGLSTEPLVGGNFRITEFQAALLRSQMRRLPQQMQRREETATFLDQRLSAIPGITPQARTGGATAHAHHLYIFRYHAAALGGVQRESFIQALQAEGIPCHGGYHPLYRAEFLRDDLRGTAAGWRDFSDRSYYDLHLPETEALCQEAVWLTQRLLLGSPEQTEAIAAAVEKIYRYREELRG